MKTTVRTSNNRIEVSPAEGVPGRIQLTILSVAGEYLASAFLSPDQAGALEFGMEMALEVHDVAAQRMAA